jgi:hypothetical protein
MPAFKPKTNKKINVCKKYLTTLGGKHAEFVNEFESDETVLIPKLKKERAVYKYRLKNEDLNIEEELEIRDRIAEITDNIRELKKKKNNYYLNNSKYIFEYFENKKNIENSDENNVKSVFFRQKKHTHLKIMLIVKCVFFRQTRHI